MTNIFTSCGTGYGFSEALDHSHCISTVFSLNRPFSGILDRGPYAPHKELVVAGTYRK